MTGAMLPVGYHTGHLRTVACCRCGDELGGLVLRDGRFEHRDTWLCEALAVLEEEL